jgi:hypothetical protein
MSEIKYPIKGSFFFTFLFFFLPDLSFSQSAMGIRGVIVDEEGEKLPFATVFIKSLGEGGTTNQDGYFEIQLPSGTFDVYFQFMGYQTEARQVVVRDKWVSMGEIIMKEQTFQLKELNISSNREDPAYTIMRKAISKSKANLLQVESYTARVYMRGTGQLDKAPFFMKKTLKKEGIAVNEAYTSESVSEVKFSQPNKLEEKVISIRSSGDDNSTSPNIYITTSIYNPKVASIISPLSPLAFTYYKFAYEGSFMDKGVEVNKIKVIPRSKGDQVFEGYIYIIENLWQVHSLDLTSSIMGIEAAVNQLYQPVKENVWMPISHTYKFNGSVMGFGGNYKYIATVDYKELEINPAFQTATVAIIDSKVEDFKQTEKEKTPKARDIEAIEKKLQSGKEIDRKEYRKMVNAYEKEQRLELDESDVISERTFKVDSNARKQDSIYWSSVRSIPLTEKELKGYQRDDSVFQMKKVNAVDTANKDFRARKKFQPSHLLLGQSYNLKNRKYLSITSLLNESNFNTVEALHFAFGVTLRKSGLMDFIKDSVARSWSIQPKVKYSFGLDQPLGRVDMSRTWRKYGGGTYSKFSAEGGRWNQQFNNSDPIHPIVNLLSTLFFQQNWMKLYQEDFISVQFDRLYKYKFGLNTSLKYTERGVLENQTNFTLWRLTNNEYTPNQPTGYAIINEEVFQPNQRLIFTAEAKYQPFLKFRKYNGRLNPIDESSPVFRAKIRQGMPEISELASTFTQLEGGFSHQFRLGVSLIWDVDATLGTFLNSQDQFFADYKHFDGNRTILGSIRPTNSYRLLDYYRYSTNSSYLSTFTHFRFRKLLLSRLPQLRNMGVKENIFVNYLKTTESPHYVELGYTLDNLLRIFRLEIAVGMENGQLLPVRPRLGIATFISINSGN